MNSPHRTTSSHDRGFRGADQVTAISDPSLVYQNETDEPAKPVSGIRACQSSDIPAVAVLFQKTFLNPRKRNPVDLGNYLNEIFLRHPWYDPEIPSWVYLDEEGRVSGFIGVMSMRMTYKGESVRAGIAGSLMVEDPARNPLVGARLVRRFLSGPQDISLSESANALSTKMWEQMGVRPIIGYSLDWLRILHPAGFGAAVLKRAFRPAFILRPLASAIDKVGERISQNPFRLDVSDRKKFYDREISDNELIENILLFAKRHSLKPEWDTEILKWLLKHSQQKRQFGALHKRAVYLKSNDQPIGLYIYYGQPGDIARVLQVMALPNLADRVIESLLTHASKGGCVAVRGRVFPDITEAVARQKSVLLNHSSMIAHSKRPDIQAAINSGDVLMTGLAGEAWARIIGDKFENH